ncbi:MAG TPA: Ig-like domain-containing protein [Verrucomicrobiae bacterium]|nr:Ig-like domain-containing protein [Verrucomicrobiae bacterium]
MKLTRVSAVAQSVSLPVEIGPCRLFNLPAKWAVVLTALLFSAVQGLAQTTVTPNPADGATGVSRSAAVVFTFSGPMNSSSTSAFFQSPPSTFYPVTSTWSAGNTVLTCTPMSAFPASTTVDWTVAGLDAGMSFVTATGSFTTGTSGGGGGGGGTGTNATTGFVVSKIYNNVQTNASAPVPMGGFLGAYSFTASTVLASNRSATSVTMTLPNGSTTQNLTQNPVAHEDYFFFDVSNSTPTSFEAAYPQGNYVFNVTGTPSNLQATLNLPTSMAQPNAPHFTQFSLLQAVDPSKPFTVKWDPFTNGTAADAITLDITDGGGKTVFATPGPGTNGFLNGTALSEVVPAGTLAVNSSNTAQLIFYRWVSTSNANYVTFGYRATSTQIPLQTVSGGTSATNPVVTHPVWEAKGLGFDVATTPNQPLKVRFTTDLTLPVSQWQIVLTTNSPGANFHMTVPIQPGAGFFRLQNGP